MKHAFSAVTALLGAVAMALPITMYASGASMVQLAQAHGNHHDHGTHGHSATAQHAPAPTPQALAAMPVSASVAISDCWIRSLPLPAPSAGYFIASNKGSTPVMLTAAASARYGDVMLHQTTHTDGMSRMSSVDAVEIAPGTQLQFKPGSYHIMLEKPTGEIKVGDIVPMQFVLASGEKAQADCEVKPANTLAK